MISAGTLGPRGNSGFQPGGPLDGIVYAPDVAIGSAFIATRTNANTLGKSAGISAALITDLHALASFSNNVNTILEGSTVDDVTLSWTYNRNGNDPASQSINQGVPAIANNLRQTVLANAGIVNDITWTITSVGDDASLGAPVGNPSSRQTSIDFRPAYYSGVDSAVINTGAGVTAAFAGSELLGNSRARTYNFDASVNGGANYLYIAYPAAFGLPNETFFNGFAFNAYTVVVDNITNSEGFVRQFNILRTNNAFNGANIVWQIT